MGNQKYTIDDMILFAKSRGGKCLSKEYINGKTKYNWECSKGHKWNAIWESINLLNTWCPHCAGNIAHTLEDMQKIAISRGGKCLSKKYTSMDAKYNWECKEGHIWKSSFNPIYTRGSWCGICSRSGINEELLRTAFECIFKTKFNKVKPKWLKSPNNTQMEIDGFSKELSLGFEYQGRQHFEKGHNFITTDDELAKRIMYDDHKVKLCKQNNVYLVVIDYKVNFRGFAEEIKKKCIELGFSISKYDFDCEIDWGKAYIKDDRIPELEEIAQSKNGKLLSDIWLGVKEHYSMKCNECGHIWKAVGSELLGGSWCDKCARRKEGERMKLGINALQEFADKFGGKCLSTKYVKRKHKYNWLCSKKHTFVGDYNNMKYRNQFCPTCEGRRIRKSLNLRTE